MQKVFYNELALYKNTLFGFFFNIKLFLFIQEVFYNEEDLYKKTLF